MFPIFIEIYKFILTVLWADKNIDFSINLQN